MTPQLLSFHLHAFFVQRLVQERQASPHTVASYRDTFRLLLTYVSDQLKTAPTDLQITDIDAEMVGRFLMFVETTRGNSARSRNTPALLHSVVLQIHCHSRTTTSSPVPENPRNAEQAIRKENHRLYAGPGNRSLAPQHPIRQPGLADETERSCFSPCKPVSECPS